MIKRVTGAVFALCVLAVIVFTVLGRGSYRSLLPEKDGAATEAAAATAETAAKAE